ncbi:MAG: pyridoxal 5'-phosphate synthase glutaminase subunit PdxT [Anaerolineae bacterium]|nr:pyridoxal 5'-phosphate synthase glutaminase subunit PdxT [Anaerolineae bacterium]
MIAPQNLTLRQGDTPAFSSSLKIGVLALQGAFLEHANMVRRLGATPVEVRLPRDLTDLDGLIIPGGESTTIGKLASQFGLLDPLHQFIDDGRAVWGTCAGLIFLAKDIGATGTGGHVVPPRLEVMDVKVNRNAFGRQVASFEADLNLTFVDDVPFHAIFIRAPKIEAVGDGVDVLATLDDGTIVAARQGNLLGTSFHPELTDDLRFHHYFLTMAQQKPSS